MRSPALAMANNLMWTRSGTVWAMWRINGLPYGFRPNSEKQKARSLHTGLIRGLPGESLWLGVCAGLNPAVVVERMLDGVDLDKCPDWVAECAATLETLDEIGPGQRLYVLAVPLADTSKWQTSRASMRAAITDLRDQLALPRLAISDTELAERGAQAAKLEKLLPGKFAAEPMTPAQMVWLHLHAAQRGLFLDTDWPEQDNVDHPDHLETLVTPTAGAALPEMLLDEGGQTDVDKKAMKRWNPIDNRYLKIQQLNAGSVPASYQGLQVLTDVPSGGAIFPGCEFIGRIDESGLEVDWAMRLTVRSSEEVKAANTRALNNLQDQFDQREHEVSASGGSLNETASDLGEYTSILESDKLEVETQATVIFAVGSDTVEDVKDQSTQLAKYMSSMGYKLTQHLGYQKELWWAMMPGVPSSRAVREFAQITTSRALAATVPFASTDLGDNRGSMLGWNISTGRAGVVLHDIAGATLRDTSGSIAIAGELGSGKSVLMKKLCGDVVDQDGLVIAIDRTNMGEWEVWARSITDTTVVNIDKPEFSLDPLRLFGSRLGSRVAQSFLITLLNLAPNTPEGAQMTRVLSTNYLEQHGITSLGELLVHLTSGDCEIPTAADLADRINMYAKGDFGDVIFDGSLPRLPVEDLRALVIRTHTLELPTRSEMENEHLFSHMRLEKWFGRAIYALVGSLAREICFSDMNKLGVLAVDECYHLVGSPEGEEQTKIWVRDGRKHRAAVILGGHDPAVDFGSVTLRGLIPTRVLMRHRDRTLAKRGLEWLDLDETDEELIEILVSETSPVQGNGVPVERRGEAFMRDSLGRIGRIKVQAPLVPSRFAAVSTSPVNSAGDEVVASESTERS